MPELPAAEPAAKSNRIEMLLSLFFAAIFLPQISFPGTLPVYLRWLPARAQGETAGNLRGVCQETAQGKEDHCTPAAKPRAVQAKTPAVANQTPGCFPLNRSRRPIDSRRPNQVGCRQVFWLPGCEALTHPFALQPQPSAAPSHPRHARGKWPLAAVVAGHSGASAADSHGLPFVPAHTGTPATHGTLMLAAEPVKRGGENRRDFFSRECVVVPEKEANFEVPIRLGFEVPQRRPR